MNQGSNLLQGIIVGLDFMRTEKRDREQSLLREREMGMREREHRDNMELGRVRNDAFRQQIEAQNRATALAESEHENRLNKEQESQRIASATSLGQYLRSHSMIESGTNNPRSVEQMSTGELIKLKQGIIESGMNDFLVPGARVTDVNRLADGNLEVEFYSNGQRQSDVVSTAMVDSIIRQGLAHASVNEGATTALQGITDYTDAQQRLQSAGPEAYLSQARGEMSQGQTLTPEQAPQGGTRPRQHNPLVSEQEAQQLSGYLNPQAQQPQPAGQQSGMDPDRVARVQSITGRDFMNLPLEEKDELLEQGSFRPEGEGSQRVRLPSVNTNNFTKDPEGTVENMEFTPQETQRAYDMWQQDLAKHKRSRAQVAANLLHEGIWDTQQAANFAQYGHATQSGIDIYNAQIDSATKAEQLIKEQLANQKARIDIETARMGADRTGIENAQFYADVAASAFPGYGRMNSRRQAELRSKIMLDMGRTNQMLSFITGENVNVANPETMGQYISGFMQRQASERRGRGATSRGGSMFTQEVNLQDSATTMLAQNAGLGIEDRGTVARVSADLISLPFDAITFGGFTNALQAIGIRDKALIDEAIDTAASLSASHGYPTQVTMMAINQMVEEEEQTAMLEGRRAVPRREIVARFARSPEEYVQSFLGENQ